MSALRILTVDQLQAALDANLAYQTKLREQLRAIVNAQQEARERLIKEEEDAPRVGRGNLRAVIHNAPRRTGLGAFRSRYSRPLGQPFFEDGIASRPTMPPEMASHAQALQRVVDCQPANVWTATMDQALREAVIQDRVRAARSQVLLAHGYADEQSVPATSKEAVMSEVSRAQEAVASSWRTIDAASVNWTAVAGVVRSCDAMQACARWTHYIGVPEGARQKWTTAESNALSQIVQQHGGRDWVQIAATHGHKRTAFECLQQYQTVIRASKAGAWSAEESDRLDAAVAEHGKKWTVVARLFPGRTPDQLRLRYTYGQKPDKRIGRFSENEDMALLLAVRAYGPVWDRVSQVLPNRTSQQCRDRYLSVLSAMDNQPWTAAEDAQLRNCVAKYGSMWGTIAAELPSRNPAMCRIRWAQLTATAAEQEPESVHSRSSPSPTVAAPATAEAPVVDRSHLLQAMSALLEEMED